MSQCGLNLTVNYYWTLAIFSIAIPVSSLTNKHCKLNYTAINNVEIFLVAVIHLMSACTHGYKTEIIFYINLRLELDKIFIYHYYVFW